MTESFLISFFSTSWNRALVVDNGRKGAMFSVFRRMERCHAYALYDRIARAGL